MADRGRDLTINLVTEDDQFDTSQAARDLQNLGDAADDTARQQADLGTSADRAQGDLDRLAQSAQDAGRAVRDVDDAATSTRGGLDDLDDAAEQTGGAFGDMRDEAGAALAETAGSFDGTMQGVIDGAQGALPALGAAFGGVGLAVGSAFALGIGMWKADAEALKEEASTLTSQLITDGGRLSRESVLGKLSELAADGTLADLADQAKAAKVPMGDFLLAAAGDTDAIERTNAALDARRAAIFDVNEVQGVYNDNIRAAPREEERQAVEKATDAINAQSEAQQLANAAVQAYDAAAEAAADTSEKAAEAQNQYADALSGVSDEAGAMADAITAGIDAVIAAQNRQLEAAANFEDNTKAVFDAVGEAGVQWALAQGENADEAMQLLADAPIEKAQLIAANYATLGQRSASQLVTSLLSQSSSLEAAGAEMIRRVQVGLDSRPLTFRTKIDPTGYDSGVRTIIRNGSVNV